ncbi:MAG: hypothetical protein A3G52_03730 [Candidatus Taylorbacteria bacterium RIFCSPLOWO2_12_FULL_43_20]|uniref:Uncharacterized protein n=1 Tax=Candidatus Taylorbacteria bacterium RIFCSPLOWO2_12_FULL_43_20 TaxID=1802332 RepID=A0A1G2P1R9_9BACT|nr:MAG: hypothetical protein A2825_00720 [Candidatus Taylorbacteria bacterium RIFCSPHIGHO2_01_FULL_43_120]OHA22870.1 MAG: hypothetical protein A3B98_01595 [Candidatus Taylorbacteria bacterium RIFCSPHIGHO2_02_FULL_43_55]OHA29347.1 MAG: hypothetical protein A3E92_02300 [Candidatus Taylorbacteria bacterium RIFCSPHIGHO2_12_FULL_42_34]OHA31724.1 MAG: hypothetical protein A3B09_01745 [Candidatus Taylorbacteria bacterium RIFCSPLOWO2_01_FULL_43_83]OHA38775.1 MAG: hypothetical protein A3H58_01855 [Candi
MTILNCWTEPKADDIGRCLSALFYSERGKKIDLDIRTESDHFPCVRYIRLISFGSVGDEVSLMAFEGQTTPKGNNRVIFWWTRENEKFDPDSLEEDLPTRKIIQIKWFSD